MAEDGAGPCWCFTTPIAEGVIERIPPVQRGRACICERCASGGGADREAIAPGR
jgi:Cysteine-rich CWC